VKIKDVIQESVYDFFSKRQAARQNALSQQTSSDATKAAPELLKKALAFFRDGGPALTAQDQQMIAQIDQERKANNLPAINWKTGNLVVQPAGPSKVVQNFTLDSRNPLIYFFAPTKQYFTVNKNNQWVFWHPTSKTIKAGVDDLTAQLLTQAADRDGIELVPVPPTPHNAPVTQTTTPQPQVFSRHPARTGTPIKLRYAGMPSTGAE